MEKLKQYKYIILILLVVLGFAFYWNDIRPSIIKKACFREAREQAIKKADRGDDKFFKDDYDTYYKWCLQKKGL